MDNKDFKVGDVLKDRRTGALRRIVCVSDDCITIESFQFGQSAFLDTSGILEYKSSIWYKFLYWIKFKLRSIALR